LRYDAITDALSADEAGPTSENLESAEFALEQWPQRAKSPVLSSQAGKIHMKSAIDKEM
jgi:hypothetical protein